MRLKARHSDRQTDSVTTDNVMFDQSLRCDLDTAKPFDAEPFEAPLKMSMNGIGPRKTNECFLDVVPFPQLFSVRQLGFLLDQ